MRSLPTRIRNRGEEHQREGSRWAANYRVAPLSTVSPTHPIWSSRSESQLRLRLQPGQWIATVGNNGEAGLRCRCCRRRWSG